MWLLSLVLVTLAQLAPGVTAQSNRIAASSLTTGDLGSDFSEVILPGLSGFGHDGLVSPPQPGSLRTYSAFFERDVDPTSAVGGPLLIGNVIGEGGPADLDRILVFFLTRAPARPPAPYVAPTEGPAVGDDSRWIAFSAHVLEPGLRVPFGQVLEVHAVAFRQEDHLALVMTAGPPATVTQQETLGLAQRVAARLAGRAAKGVPSRPG